MNVLDAKMPLPNDADAITVRDYLGALLRELWCNDEGFSGKRPFGNSGWQNDLYRALVMAQLIKGEIDEDGYLQFCDKKTAHRLILKAIASL